MILNVNQTFTSEMMCLALTQIACELSESARERRIALYKSDQQQQQNQGFRRDQKIKKSYRREVELDPHICPEEIISREVELDPQVSPEEIISREVELDPQVSPEEIISREVELG